MSDAVARLRSEGAFDGLGLRIQRAQRLRGHASTRRFYRVGSGRGSSILVLYPRGQEGEIERYETTAGWFRHAGVRVPRVIARGERALLVEDGGDALLDAYPGSASERVRCYRQAGTVMVRIERYARLAGLPNEGWALDQQRLRKELDFFEQHTVRGWLEIDTGGNERAGCYERLAAACAMLPTVGCHRDFHARNLLVRDARLIVLDFQDVMSGPVFYDAASLVWDNYCDLERALVADLLSTYWWSTPRRATMSSEWGAPDGPPGLPREARQAFNLVALQRSLKALGTFGYQVSVAGNRGFASYVARTWRHAERATADLGWAELSAALAPVARALA